MKETIIYLFVDALGWEIVSRNNFMVEELPHRQKVKMQFGYSSTAIPTILSGKYPREHGHFSFFYFDPKNSPFKKFKYLKYFFGAGLHPKCIMNRGRIRRYVSKLFAKIKGYTGYFQLYAVPYNKLPYLDYCEKNDIFALNGLSPVKNLRDVLADGKLNFHISDWHKSEDENIAAAVDEIESGNLDFAFVYTAAFDSFMHDNVNDESAIAMRLKKCEGDVKKLLSALKKAGRPFKLTVISDHGMTPKTATIDLQKIVGETGLKFGVDYASVFDSTMLRLWYLKPDAREKIRDRLLRGDCMGAFVSESDKIKYGIDFPDNKFGEDIFLMGAGVQIEPSDMGNKALNGMHGFSPEDKDSFASIMSTAPLRFEPAQVKDFFTLMHDDIKDLKNANVVK